MRAKGTFDEPSNYEGKFAWTLDARNMVQSYADLLTFTAANYINNGFPVAVFDVDPNKRGLYICINKNALSDPNSWEKQAFNSSLYYTAAQIDEILENFTPGTSSGVGSREIIIGFGDWVASGSFDISGYNLSGTERPISLYIYDWSNGVDATYAPKTLTIAEYEDGVIYADFPDGFYTASIIIMGTPQGTPPPTNGIVSSNPNEFTFTPSDDYVNP